jgi:hypothetical protein
MVPLLEKGDHIREIPQVFSFYLFKLIIAFRKIKQLKSNLINNEIIRGSFHLEIKSNYSIIMITVCI